MQKLLTYTLLYFIPVALIAYGIWQNILALIIGLAWIASSFIIFEIPKHTD
ncbi:hypothetical protein [Candidatus Aciduliprofundum boonei]|uniref:hypothetical protein n=1 Tax=Candidatus Aciduliprofundum boonei TaxID=379547 RepID=UPI0001C2643C|nr:hypothetical protein [Candidatus Aciduliprofundum boonei]HII55899.1 hypothetical protein [Candidatus Aciduliprofundum boonei]